MSKIEKIILLDKLLAKATRENKRLSTEYLLGELGIEKRSLQGYFNDLKDEYNLIVDSKRNHGYQYDLSNNEKPLCERDKIDKKIENYLITTLNTFSSLQHYPFYELIESLKIKLESKISDLQQDIKPENRFILFDDQHVYRGVKFFTPIAEAIQEQKQIVIQHKKYYTTQFKNYTVHPYYLKEYDNRWYLIAGIENDYQEFKIITFGLDRINSVNKLDGNVNFANKPNLEYFQNLIGISKDENDKPVQIQIRMDLKQWPYFENNPIYPKYQIIKEEPDFKIIEFKAIINYELEKKIMSQIDFLEIIAPIELKNKIVERVKNAIQKNQFKI